MEVRVKSIKHKDGDHLFFEDTNVNDYIDNAICDGCKTEMEAISVLKNANAEIGLITGLCPQCGYIKRIRNLSVESYNLHFSNKWLVRRQEEIVENPYVYNKMKPYISKTGSVLDVGCGLGCSLLTFHNLGYDVYGVEPSKHRSEEGKKIMKNIETGFAEEYLENTNNYFDVIILFDVLQFVDNPFYVLELAINRLTKNGKIFVKMGTFGHKSNYSQFSHLGVSRNIVSLYALKSLLFNYNVYPISYENPPCEIIISKQKGEKTNEILNIAKKTNETDVLKYAKKTLKYWRLYFFHRVELSYNGRKTKLILNKPINKILPIIFKHESKKLPILLK